MIKPNSKVIAALLALQFLVPAVASAQVRAREVKPETFCTRTAALSAQIGSRLSEQGKKIDAKRASRLKTLSSQREAATEKRAEMRDDRKDAVGEALKKLDEKATTDAQRAALDVFKTTMEAARAARVTAVDAAQKAFRSGLDALIAARKASEDRNIADFRAAVQAAFDKAKADCASGTDPETVRTALRDALTDARDAYRAAHKGLDPQGQGLKTLLETRKAAYLSAHDAFKTAAEKARTDLKTALKAAGPDAATNTAQ